MEFFGRYLSMKCRILAGHHEFGCKLKLLQKNLKFVSSHPELRPHSKSYVQMKGQTQLREESVKIQFHRWIGKPTTLPQRSSQPIKIQPILFLTPLGPLDFPEIMPPMKVIYRLSWKQNVLCVSVYTICHNLRRKGTWRQSICRMLYQYRWSNFLLGWLSVHNIYYCHIQEDRDPWYAAWMSTNLDSAFCIHFDLLRNLKIKLTNWLWRCHTIFRSLFSKIETMPHHWWNGQNVWYALSSIVCGESQLVSGEMNSAANSCPKPTRMEWTWERWTMDWKRLSQSVITTPPNQEEEDWPSPSSFIAVASHSLSIWCQTTSSAQCELSPVGSESLVNKPLIAEASDSILFRNRPLGLMRAIGQNFNTHKWYKGEFDKLQGGIFISGRFSWGSPPLRPSWRQPWVTPFYFETDHLN